MKKILLFAFSITLLNLSMESTLFAYYSAEDFRIDMKSYLDTQQERQIKQDMNKIIQDTINTPVQTGPSQSYIDFQNEMQRIKMETEATMADLNAQIKAMSDAEDAKNKAEIQKIEQRIIKQCLEIKVNQEGSLAKMYTNIEKDRVDVCASYDVLVKTSDQAIKDKYNEDAKKEKELETKKVLIYETSETNEPKSGIKPFDYTYGKNVKTTQQDRDQSPGTPDDFPSIMTATSASSTNLAPPTEKENTDKLTKIKQKFKIYIQRILDLI